MIIKLLLLKINRLHKEKHITDQQNTLLINKANGLIDILGKCERIRNTPIPIAYAFLLKFFIVVYVVILPIGMLHDLGWWTILLVAILYYILMSIVLIAEEIEEPFGQDMNDLSTDEMAQNIERNIKEIYNSKEG
ncbi:MAG: bestrophin family protein [Cytophagaceae bacterium]|nr:bestrophin family protein [Cytophagaceae bacterium]